MKINKRTAETASDLQLRLGGAKGTRTPDPLLANNRQHVHPSVQPQVRVHTQPQRSAGIRTCCGLSCCTCTSLSGRAWVCLRSLCQGNARMAVVSDDTSILTRREKHA